MKCRTALPLVLLVSCYACGPSTSIPSTSTSRSASTSTSTSAPTTTTTTTTTTTSTSQSATGPEHLSWSQAAASDTELASIRFAIYVDGSRSELAGSSCAASTTQDVYDCSAPLPTLTPGSHTLQMAAYYAGFEQTESLSPTLVFFVGPDSTVGSLD